MTLPGDARAAGVLADRDTWIVATRDTARRRIARPSLPRASSRVGRRPRRAAP